MFKELLGIIIMTALLFWNEYFKATRIFYFKSIFQENNNILKCVQKLSDAVRSCVIV